VKNKVPIVPTHQLIQVVLKESTVKKKRRCKKHSIPDVNFTNKRPSHLLYRKLRNQNRDNEKLTPLIEVDDHFFEDEIEYFIDQEDIDDRIMGKNINTDGIQFDFISNIPPFLKKQEGFFVIQHDLKQITGQTKFPFAEHAQPLPTIEIVH